jgi:C-terminal processing protease CtpA/Prc
MFGAITNTFQTEQYFKRFGTTEALRGWVPETYNLGYLPRVYMITSRSSCSSSELIISTLKAKMKVITVGDNTFGKSVISTILTDETDKFPFVIMPAYSSYYNAMGQSENARPEGFIPDYRTDDNILPFFPLGDTNETLLRKTLDIINDHPDNQTVSGKYQVIFRDDLHHYDSHNPFVTK